MTNKNTDDLIHFNKDQEAYAKSGKVEKAAAEASRAREDAKERSELEQAEEKGKSARRDE